ncbi:hypothetical protein C0Q70_04537 [Pomacea canaliculata]|uniref:Uncharacterized protein n=1 Tax=Pomacea canaliculata TaxID=400727 RepID=A0A2T7PIP6_POMCA|nr:hypothetical protein C0Q70_04537 [Pomacea canaliculata]
MLGVNRLSTGVSDLSLVPSTARSQVFLDSTRSSQTELSHTPSSRDERLHSTFATTVISSSEFAFLQMAHPGTMQASSQSAPALHPQSLSITSSFNGEASSRLPSSSLDDNALPTSTVRGLSSFSSQEQPSQQSQQPFEGSSTQRTENTADHTVQSASAVLSGETSVMARTDEITNSRSELPGLSYPTQVLSSNYYSDFRSPDFKVDMTVSDILRATPVTMATLSSLHLDSASSSSVYLQSQQILLSSSITEHQELVSKSSQSDICSPSCSIRPTVAFDEQTTNVQTPVMTSDQPPRRLEESITSGLLCISLG